MPRREPLYPHVPKSQMRTTAQEEESVKRVLVALTRDELDILEGVVREELGLITEGELKAIILKATRGKSSWEGGLTPLLTVLHPR